MVRPGADAVGAVSQHSVRGALKTWSQPPPELTASLTLISQLSFFVTLPLQHAESRRLQELGVELAGRVVSEAEVSGESGRLLKNFFDGLVGYPDQHYDCIERFGR